VVFVPAQIVSVAGVIITTGVGFTVTFLLAVAVHPLALVTVTVYVVLITGLTVVDAESLPLLQPKVEVPVTPVTVVVSVVLEPLHTVTKGGLIVTAGLAFTLTITLSVAEQPLPLVTVTL
jgi:hypothetical protein